MTQNLDWDLPTGTNKTISKDNTDLTADQTGLTITGYTNSVTGVEEWGNQNDALKFYNPGLYVYTTPTEVNGCPDTTNLSNCTSYGWKEYEPGDDEHYLAGNYYSWAAATAGAGNSVTTANANASSSICPEKWKLPYSRDTNNGTRGSFYFLLNKYGLTGIVTGTGLDGQSYNIASAPLYFVRGGWLGQNSLNSAGLNSNYWSRAVPSGTNAYYLTFNNADVYPSYNYLRHRGLSIRCLVI